MPSLDTMHSTASPLATQSPMQAGAVASPQGGNAPGSATQLKVLQQWERRLLAVLNANTPGGGPQQAQGAAEVPKPDGESPDAAAQAGTPGQTPAQRSGTEWIPCPLGVRCTGDGCQSATLHHRYFRLDKRDIRRIHWSDSATEESNFRGLKRRLEARGFKRNKDKEEPSRRHISVWFDAEGVLSGGNAVAAEVGDMYASPPRATKSSGRVEKAKSRSAGRVQGAHAYAYDMFGGGFVHPSMMGADGARMMHGRGASPGMYAQYYGSAPYGYPQYSAGSPYPVSYRPHPGPFVARADGSFASPQGAFPYPGFYPAGAAGANGPRAGGPMGMSPHAQGFYGMPGAGGDEDGRVQAAQAAGLVPTDGEQGAGASQGGEDVPVLKAADGTDIVVPAAEVDAHMAALRSLVAEVKQRLVQAGPAGLLPTDGQQIDSVAQSIASRGRRVAGDSSEPLSAQEHHRLVAVIRRAVDASVVGAVNRAAGKPGGLDMIASLASVRLSLHADGSPHSDANGTASAGGASPAPGDPAENAEGLGMIESRLSSGLCVE